MTRAPRPTVVPLPDAIRAPLETLIGADLRSVRVHIGSARAVALGARAFARGDALHFAPDAWDPDTPAGWHVIGHELAHIVQQRCGRVRVVPGTVDGVARDATLEREAEAVGVAAARVRAGRPVGGPLFRRRIPAAHQGLDVIQCLVTVEEFKKATTVSMAARDKIKAVDTALAQFHVGDAKRPTDPRALLRQIRAIVEACQAYRRLRPDSKRLAGVDSLLAETDIEERILIAWAAAASETDQLKKYDALEEAYQGIVDQNQRGLSLKRSSRFVGEIQTQVEAQLRLLEGASMAKEVVKRDLQELRRLADADGMPDTLKAALREATNPAHVRQLDYTTGTSSSVMFNPINGATKKYSVKHGAFQANGRVIRLGTLFHELTHVAVSEAFKNTSIMLAISPSATDTDMLQLATRNKASLTRIKNLVPSSGLLAWQQSEVLIKVDYPFGPIFSKYLQICLVQDGPVMHARLNGLAVTYGVKAELNEFDTVINQMALWCHLWKLPATNPLMTELLAEAKAAYDRRSAERQRALVIPRLDLSKVPPRGRPVVPPLDLSKIPQTPTPRGRPVVPSLDLSKVKQTEVARGGPTVPPLDLSKVRRKTV